MSLLAFITDVLFMAACGVLAYLGAVFSYLGMGLAGRTGGWPIALVAGLAGLVAILYFPHAIPHFFASIPQPHWWW
jgi:hypothetical protein